MAFIVSIHLLTIVLGFTVCKLSLINNSLITIQFCVTYDYHLLNIGNYVFLLLLSCKARDRCIYS